MFLDRVKIFVKAGAGGDGAATFRREAHVPRGGPDGGDGGPGGDVLLVADADLRDLSSFRARQWFKAEKGGAGGGNGRHGASGDDVELRVPVGTQVYDEDEQLVAQGSAFVQAATRELERSKRSGGPVGVAMLDVDDEGRNADWGAHVTDEEYGAA